MFRSLTKIMDPDIEGPNFFVFGHARHSSHPGAPTMAQTLQGMVQTINSYNNLLNSPAYQNMIEGQRPGGAGTAMQSHRTVIARHGAMPVPTQTGNLIDPMLHAFLAMFDHLTRANNPHPPTEIHFLLLGIAGFSVGIEGWGDRTQGFFREILSRDAANSTNYAGRIHLVFVMEPHVVDPASPASINSGQQPHGVRFLNKQVVKVRLEDMVDRYTALRTHAVTIGQDFFSYTTHIMQKQQGLPNIFNNVATPLPQFPQHLGGQAMADKLDRMIIAMFWEKAWRVAWLAPGQAAVVHARNDDRNTPM